MRYVFFFFSSRRRHTRYWRDWSSDVCSSDLYRYACRNYRAGDEIYGFGFSRGAFTMRLVIALIASQGLVQSTSERELDRRSRCAYRAFRKSFLPRRLEWPTRAVRAVRDAFVAWRWRRSGEPAYARENNHHPVIRFV